MSGFSNELKIPNADGIPDADQTVYCVDRDFIAESTKSGDHRGGATSLHAVRRTFRTDRRRNGYAAWSTNSLPPQPASRSRAGLPREVRPRVREAVCSLLRDADVSREP